MSAATHFDNSLRYLNGSDPRHVHLTPEYVLERVRADLGGSIELDPCTETDNPTGAHFFYVDRGLERPWAGAIFCNPPYGKAREPWVDRCIEAGAAGHRVVLLMPAATDTRCFQRAAHSADEIVFVCGRLKFGVLRPNRRQRAASHPSALFGWNANLDRCAVLGLRLAASPKDNG
jgi:hypothetical protein